MTLTALDPTDLKILSVLQNEGRISKTDLAERVNLSPSPCWVRLQRLEDEGYITSYSANIVLDKLFSFSTVMVEVSLKSHTKNDFIRFEEAVQSMDHVVDCYATGGGIDYILRIVAKDIDLYQKLIDEMLDADIGIDRYFTYIVTKTVKSSNQIKINALLDN
ncbi:Lrp/AsnC family transcriptional regulator [Pseudemcibacter aquimaris]|uniref:Lrp/AsnC family transcriptional regulator n=1 Tax=Pseudemcibacter aquimaris TaxID=2857064 RepID=UPI002011EABF|nr:Lrp/AsnC family transcriptional regulator [Pseudemcibacter aquimaris]MCC3861246.1 Lrp/AsnC family transcriptional regulator [Pseudemcibacter aquimaris]WDU58020.1 Lrp/AsnC family transcriptional regulator [Pseudemcibacter aquimaris]